MDNFEPGNPIIDSFCNSKNPIYLLGTAGMLTYANIAAVHHSERQVGHPPEHGGHFTSFLQPAESGRLEVLLPRVLKGEAIRYYDLDGRSVRLEPIHAADGGVASIAYSIENNFTVVRETRSDLHLETIFRYTEIGHILMDVDMNILSFNDSARLIALRLNNKVLRVGGHFPDFARDEQGRERILDYLKSVLEGENIDYERHVPNDRGEDDWYSISLRPVFEEDGKISMLIISLQDITERKRNEMHLNQSFDLVSAQNKRLLSFSYIVSHNLRSHSSNIISIVDFLKDADSDHERDEMIGHLKDVTTSLDNTLSSLNDIISIHTNINLIFEPLILSAFIKQAIDVLRDQIALKNATIVNNVGKDVVINYNPAYIESIILNFLSNALKYSHSDRAPIITLDFSMVDGKPVLSIADNGIGIDLKRNGEKLFGLYKTFNGNKDARGIGLFITKSQIDFMGGKVAVESQPGVGTTFKIHF